MNRKPCLAKTFKYRLDHQMEKWKGNTTENNPFPTSRILEKNLKRQANEINFLSILGKLSRILKKPFGITHTKRIWYLTSSKITKYYHGGFLLKVFPKYRPLEIQFWMLSLTRKSKNKCRVENNKTADPKGIRADENKKVDRGIKKSKRNDKNEKQ